MAMANFAFGSDGGSWLMGPVVDCDKEKMEEFD